MFSELKQNSYEPNLRKEDSGFDHQSLGIEMVKKLPGISAGNHKSLITKGKTLKDLINMNEADLGQSLGKKNGKELYKFANYSSYTLE